MDSEGYFTIELTMVIGLVFLVVLMFTTLLFFEFQKTLIEIRLNYNTMRKIEYAKDDNFEHFIVFDSWVNKVQKRVVLKSPIITSYKRSLYRKTIRKTYYKKIMMIKVIERAKDWLDEK